MKLSDFQVLTFDCYGTLIDWETGIINALKPWLAEAGKQLTDAEILETFAACEAKQEAIAPTMLYSDILYHVHKLLAERWQINSSEEQAKSFGDSVKNWPAFADAPQALAQLKQHYKLVILSNIDHHSFRASNEKLGVEFDAIFTAQDIGSYKPSMSNFQYLLDKLAEQGITKDKILHTAQSLYHDHVPAKQFELATCWIDRRHNVEGWGATVPPPIEVKPDFRFTSLAAMAEAREKQ